MPEGSLIRDYGIDTLPAGHGSDLHTLKGIFDYHDCDEWWVILEGHARIRWGEQVDEAFPGDTLRPREFATRSKP